MLSALSRFIPFSLIVLAIAFVVWAIRRVTGDSPEVRRARKAARRTEREWRAFVAELSDTAKAYANTNPELASIVDIKINQFVREHRGEGTDED